MHLHRPHVKEKKKHWDYIIHKMVLYSLKLSLILSCFSLGISGWRRLNIGSFVHIFLLCSVSFSCLSSYFAGHTSFLSCQLEYVVRLSGSELRLSRADLTSALQSWSLIRSVIRIWWEVSHWGISSCQCADYQLAMRAHAHTSAVPPDIFFSISPEEAS